MPNKKVENVTLVFFAARGASGDTVLAGMTPNGYWVTLPIGEAAALVLVRSSRGTPIYLKG